MPGVLCGNNPALGVFGARLWSREGVPWVPVAAQCHAGTADLVKTDCRDVFLRLYQLGFQRQGGKVGNSE